MNINLINWLLPALNSGKFWYSYIFYEAAVIKTARRQRKNIVSIIWHIPIYFSYLMYGYVESGLRLTRPIFVALHLILSFSKGEIPIQQFSAICNKRCTMYFICRFRNWKKKKWKQKGDGKIPLNIKDILQGQMCTSDRLTICSSKKSYNRCLKWEYILLYMFI